MWTIRAAGPQDSPAIAAIYRPVVEKTTVSFELAAPDADEMRRRIDRVTAEYPWLVALDGGTVAGYAYACRFRERAAYDASVEVSVYVGETARGRGAGSALYRALFAELRRAERFHRIFAGIALPNDASVALHRKLGFAPVGIYREAGRKFERWIDVAWWQRPAR